MIDVQLLAQGVLYYLISIAGFATSVSLGVTTIRFNTYCILYTYLESKNGKWITTFGSSASCGFPTYLPVFTCILYGAGMGTYHIYAVRKSRRDPTIGAQMWLIPFIMINAVIWLLMFVSSCIISVGFAKFCANVIATAKAVGYPITSCKQGEELTWVVEDDTSQTIHNDTYYGFMMIAQIASWAALILWTLQVALTVFRRYRNKHLNARSRLRDPTPDQSTPDPLDPTSINASTQKDAIPEAPASQNQAPV